MNFIQARNLIDKFKAPDQKLKFYFEKKITEYNPQNQFSEFSNQSDDQDDFYNYSQQIQNSISNELLLSLENRLQKNQYTLQKLYGKLLSQYIIYQANQYNFIKYDKEELGESFLFQRDYDKYLNLILNHQFQISEKQIQFDSNFESGNLYQAYKINKFEYDLILKKDANSKGYQQWFNFQVSGFKKDEIIQFNIHRHQSLFQEGMQPSVFSKKRKQVQGIGWKREGKNIRYIKTKILQQFTQLKIIRYYYVLSFQIAVEYNDDILQIAMNQPYTYTDLQNYLQDFQHQTKQLNYMSINKMIIRQIIPKVNLQLLVIGKKFSKAFQDQKNVFDKQNGLAQFLSQIEQKVQKFQQIIIITCRQHPGETVGSFVLEGFMNSFLKLTKVTHTLLENYVFLIIPMINIEGIIAGNFRCGAQGTDLNRMWLTDHINQSLDQIKICIDIIRKSRVTVEHVIDLHGHSAKLNSFFYCCKSECPIKDQIFPFLMQCENNQFNYESCTFSLKKSKEKSLRGYIWKKLDQPRHTLTYETSFMGYFYKEKKQFKKTDLLNLGKSLLKCIFNDYKLFINPHRSHFHKQQADNLLQQFLSQNYKETSQNNSDSDSDVSYQENKEVYFSEEYNYKIQKLDAQKNVHIRNRTITQRDNKKIDHTNKDQKQKDEINFKKIDLVLDSKQADGNVSHLNDNILQKQRCQSTNHLKSMTRQQSHDLHKQIALNNYFQDKIVDKNIEKKIISIPLNQSIQTNQKFIQMKKKIQINMQQFKQERMFNLKQQKQ